MSLRARARRRALFSFVGIALISAGLGAAPAKATFPGMPGKLTVTDHGIWTMNPDGTGLVELTKDMPFSGADPSWSSDGSKIVFTYTEGTTAAGEHYGIWIMNADGSGRRQITKAPYEVAYNDSDPALSPDGTKVAYIRNNALRIMNIDGSGDHEVGDTDPNLLYDPEWSPDGAHIAYSYNNGDIYVLNVSTNAVSNITSGSGLNEASPSWSPDGTEIAFSTTGGVDVAAVDGTNRRTLVSGIYEVWDVAWSPDRTRIAFIADTDGSGEQVWMMNADGTDVQLVNEKVVGTTLDWQPIPDRDVDLHVELEDAPDPVTTTGGTVTYTATITNESEVDTRFARLYSLVPLRSSYVSASPSQGSCKKTSASITCSLGRLEGGASATVALVVTATSGFDLSYTAQASSSQGDPDPSDNTATETTTISVIEPPAAQDPLPRLTWSIPDRLRDYTGDGIVDEEKFNNPELAAPPFEMVLDACDSRSSGQISQYGFAVTVAQGQVLEQVSSDCRFAFQPPREGNYPVTLTVTTTAGKTGSITKNVPFRDLFIVSLGDSVASGEGNPDRICIGVCHLQGSTPALWQNRRCHRSAISGPSRAAQALESSDPTSSVTFVHLACSGATVENGIVGSYKGIEPPHELAPKIPPQIEVLEQLMRKWNRKPDAVLISIGANDAKFADALLKCLELGRCFKDKEFVDTVEKRLLQLPAAYERLDRELDGAGIPGGKVFITEYFNPTRDSRGDFATCMNNFIVPSEWAWAEENVIKPLNEHVHMGADAKGHGWKVVGGIEAAYRTHGMCSTDRWVVKIDESLFWQGDPFGAFHPNVPGHVLYGRRIADVVRPTLTKWATK